MTAPVFSQLCSYLVFYTSSLLCKKERSSRFDLLLRGDVFLALRWSTLPIKSLVTPCFARKSSDYCSIFTVTFKLRRKTPANSFVIIKQCQICDKLQKQTNKTTIIKRLLKALEYQESSEQLECALVCSVCINISWYYDRTNYINLNNHCVETLSADITASWERAWLRVRNTLNSGVHYY